VDANSLGELYELIRVVIRRRSIDESRKLDRYVRVEVDEIERLVDKRVNHQSDERRRLIETLLRSIGAECSRLFDLKMAGYSLEEMDLEIGRTEGWSKKKMHNCYKRARNLLLKTFGLTKSDVL
jgi:hypothetical protein